MLRTITVALACASAACAQDSEGERLGDISLDTETQRGFYLRGAALLNGYADADLSPPGDSDITLEFDPMVAGSVAVGYHQSRGNKGFRVEGEFGYEKTDLEVKDTGESGDIELASFAANAYFDYRFNERWSWYIGGGIGGSAVEASDDVTTAEDDAAFFVQVMSGAEFRISGPFSAYGGLRLRAYETMELETDSATSDLEGFASLGLELGVMLRF